MLLGMWWELITGIAVGVLGTWVAWSLLRRRRQAVEKQRYQQAREQFRRRREQLEAQFVDHMNATGRPRGLRWKHCEFEDQVWYAVDRRTGHLVALVAVTVAFEAKPGEGMEEVEAVGRLRSATALFFHGPQGWSGQGQVLFNLMPQEVLERFAHQLQPWEAVPAPSASQ